MTNADKIRSMGDVELYELLSYIFDSGVVDGIEYAHKAGRLPVMSGRDMAIAEAE